MNRKIGNFIRIVENFLAPPVLSARKPLIIVLQLSAAVLSLYLAYLLRFDFRVPGAQQEVFWRVVWLLVACRAATLYYWKLFSGLWRYVTMDDVLLITKANIVSSLLFLGLLYMISGPGLGGLPRSVLVLDLVLYSGFLVGLRMLSRIYREYIHETAWQKKDVSNVVVAGVNSMAIRMAREISSNPMLDLRVIGFIDENGHNKRSRVVNLPILGGMSQLEKVFDKNDVHMLLVAFDHITPREIKSIRNACDRCGVKCRVLPSTQDILESLPLFKQTHELRPQEIMGRDLAVGRSDDNDPPDFSDKVVLVSGAAGSIGSELCRQLMRRKPRMLIMLDQSESGLYELDRELESHHPDSKRKMHVCDVTNAKKVEMLMQRWQPEAIYHAAAYKHVPLMEDEPVEALGVNVLGTRNLARAAAENGCKRFLFISTDKAVNPIAVMGLTKFAAEKVIFSVNGSDCKFMAVRFGNVINSNGSVVPLFRKQVEDGGPVTVTHPDVNRFFMAITEAVHLVLAAADMASGGETFLLDMGEPVKIIEVAKKVIAAAGLEPEKDIEIVFTGLRPGEKMEEILYWQGEGIQDTAHQKIKAMIQPKPDVEVISEWLKKFEHACDALDDKAAKSLLQEFVEVIS